MIILLSKSLTMHNKMFQFGQKGFSFSLQKDVQQENTSSIKDKIALLYIL